ncbi:MAG: ATP-dependent zinc metalloprotease FtsH, partial [Clostridia bacterium]|nr:ATP-dependent zinc metalloprotease FtsH [Clostridia bacterium]
GDETQYKYTVPNVNLFVNDVHEQIREYNKANPDNPIVLDYEAGTSNSWILSVLPSLLLTLGFVILMVVMFKKMNTSITIENNRAMSFGKARIKRGDEETKKVTFKDVAGADEEKEELTEIVEFLKNPTEFSKLGARIPKGVLLVGPPGTGKTLLAKAVAGEADAPFFSISGSDFVEMYVGVGASRVRDLFKEAKKSQPSIIFIDEIDAVGRHRGAGMGGGHDEREQTLNQLLVEMDGFGANEGVIVIAATNRPDILDPALLRPGRFDRQVTVGYPDIKGREDILKVHAKNKPLAPDVDLRQIAATTVGFTGADLENLLNEAALLAAKRKKMAITMNEIEEATMKVVVGSEKKSRKISDKDKKITAYHEAGHAISSYYLDNQDPVTHISIVPRGMAAGFTLYTPEQDKTHMMKSRMLDDIVSLLGGLVAEQIIFGDISTGASNDIQRATEIARNMITKYGMSEKLGPIAFGSDNDEVFLGKNYNHTRNYSESKASVIDEEVESIINNAYKRTEKILTEHIDQLHLVSDVLVKLEKIDKEQFESLMTNGVLPEEKPAEKDETVTETTEDTDNV